MKGATEKATFGGGCHVETAFSGPARRGLGMRRLHGRDSRESDIRRRLHGTNGVRGGRVRRVWPQQASPTRNFSTSSGKSMTPPLLIVPLDFWRARYKR